MSKPIIELIECEDGDWEVLRMNLGEDFFYENHSIPNAVWIKVESLGFEVEKRTISDEDMEEGNY